MKSAFFFRITTVFIVFLSAVGVSAATETTTSDSEWIQLVGSDGPTGIAKVGKNLMHCGDVRWDADSKQLTPVAGTGVIAALSKLSYGDSNNLVSAEKFGDCEVELEFLIAKGSNSGVKLQERYEIQLYDSYGKEKPSAKECGGVYPHWIWQGAGKGLKYIDEGVPPRTNAAKPAGQWQTLTIRFTAPRFDDSGKKIQNARFLSVILNGRTIHEDVELVSPTGNSTSPLKETAQAPLFLQLDHGAVAFRNVRVRPIAEVTR